MTPLPGDSTSIFGKNRARQHTAIAPRTQYITVRAPTRSDRYPPKARISPEGNEKMDVRSPAVTMVIE